MFQRSGMKMSKVFHRSCKVFLESFMGNFKGVSRAFHMGFKKVSKVTLRRFQWEFQEGLNDLS